MKNDDLGIPNLRDADEGVYVTICDREIFLHDFPKMLEIYFRELVDRDEHYSLEKLGDRRYWNGFSSENLDVPCFVKRVCEWGGRPGIHGLVLQNNTYKQIADALNDAANYVYDGDIAAALASVEKLRGLRSSYASKHLRMLRSRECVAYDKILRGEFSECYGGESDGKGYANFCALFVELARILNEDYPSIPNKERTDGKWRAADLEAAIFCKYLPRTKPIVATAIQG